MVSVGVGPFSYSPERVRVGVQIRPTVEVSTSCLLSVTFQSIHKNEGSNIK